MCPAAEASHSTTPSCRVLRSHLCHVNFSFSKGAVNFWLPQRKQCNCPSNKYIPWTEVNIWVHCLCVVYSGKLVIIYLSQSHHLLNEGIIKQAAFLIPGFLREGIYFRTLFAATSWLRRAQNGRQKAIQDQRWSLQPEQILKSTRSFGPCWNAGQSAFQCESRVWGVTHHSSQAPDRDTELHILLRSKAEIK